MQYSILEECKSYFSKVALCRATNNKMPWPLKILVFGGPGTGKSFLTNAICKEAKERDLHDGCCATTGIAVTNLPEVRTIHNFGGRLLSSALSGCTSLTVLICILFSWLFW